MKKISLIILAFLLLVTTACNKNTELDFNVIKTNLEDLTLEGFSYDESLNKAKTFLTIDDVAPDIILNEDYKSLYSIDDALIDEGIILKNKKSIIMILKPNDKKELEKQVKNYFKKNKLEYENEEIDDYLIYVKTDDSVFHLKKILDSKKKVFTELQYLNSDEILNQFGILEDKYSEALVATPKEIKNSNMYIIIKPNKKEEITIKNIIEEYFNNLEEQSINYNKGQEDLLKNKLYKKYNDYLIYIVSIDNDMVFNKIKG